MVQRTSTNKAIMELLDRIVSEEQQTPEMEDLMKRLQDCASALSTQVTPDMVVAAMAGAGYGKGIFGEPEAESASKVARAVAKGLDIGYTAPPVQIAPIETDAESTVDDWAEVMDGTKVTVQVGELNRYGLFFGVNEDGTLNVQVGQKEMTFLPAQVALTE